MYRTIVALAFLLAACAGAPEATPEPQPPMSEPAKPSGNAVPAPTPASVTQRLTIADSGKAIVVPPGGRFAVELVGIPTAGYIWQVDERPAFLSEAQEVSGNTSKQQSQPGFVGGSHWEVFVFEATGAGEGALRLAQRRPWEKTEPPSQTFSVMIKVQ